jgi:hypothetical protein
MAGSGSLPRSARSLAYDSHCSESGGGREADRKADRTAPSRFASPLLRHLCSAVGLSFALVSHPALGVDLLYNMPIYCTFRSSPMFPRASASLLSSARFVMAFLLCVPYHPYHLFVLLHLMSVPSWSPYLIYTTSNTMPIVLL